MEGGACKDAFVAWQECVEAGEEAGDMVERCYDATSHIFRCFETRYNYYGPVRRKAVSDQAEWLYQYMADGGCRDEVDACLECIDAAEEEGVAVEDMEERCSEAISNLAKCMDAHPDYYHPMVIAEKDICLRAGV
ncbi:hypothetical protein ACP70R_015283 [Stipagrostis hirtigluma subsp. patula]